MSQQDENVSIPNHSGQAVWMGSLITLVFIPSAYCSATLQGNVF